MCTEAIIIHLKQLCNEFKNRNEQFTFTQADVEIIEKAIQKLQSGGN